MSDPSPPTGAHILIFPYPAQGHMLPLLDLTHQLALHGLTITILITPKNLPILTPLLSQHPHIQTLILPFPSQHLPPSIPTGAENVKDIGNHGNIPIINALSQLTDPITHWFNSHPSPPVALISDFFLGWTHHLASQLGIPRITFYSSGAFLVSVLNHLFANMRSLQGLTTVDFPHLPNSPSFATEHLPSVFRKYKEENPDHRIVKDGMIANMSSYACILNTFDELEGAYLDSLKKELGHVRVWPVGPVSLLHGSTTTQQEDDGHGSIFTWLDGCPDGSVVYVCFGSQVTLTKRQMEALTAGLEKSGTRFVLAVKKTDDEDDRDSALVGLEDRTVGRGVVIRGWAPQVRILSHRAVGGFLTHCGWNSVLEAMVAGVVLLEWPMEADQFVNAKLVGEEMGVGGKVCEGVEAVPDSDELARTISEVMSGVGKEKVKAMEMKEKAWGAIKEGGSSMKGLKALVEELRGLPLRREKT